MTQVIYYPDGRQLDYEVIEAGSVLAAIAQIFPLDTDGVQTAPVTLDLYHAHYSQDHLVPIDEWEDVNELEGPFFLVNQPAAGAGALAIIQAVIAVASIAAAVIFAPSQPSSTQRNIRKESPNNGLSSRVNQDRVNSRVSDIAGTLRGVPDQLQVPRFEFDDHIEVEIAYMLVGRGHYEIPANQVKEGSTRVSEIPGMSVEIFGPYTSPNSGVPQLRIGNAINRPVLMTQRLDAVNGQVLQPANAGSVVNRPLVFVSPNIVRVQDSAIDLTEHFIAGDVVDISNAAQREGNYSYSLPSDSPANAVHTGSRNYEIRLPGDFSAEWAAGDVLTLTNARFTWTTQGGGEAGESYESAADLSGVYTVASVAFTGGSTRIRLGKAGDVNSAWHLIELATGFPTLSRPSGEIEFDLSGRYTINTLSVDSFTLNDPTSVNAEWDVLADDYGGESRALTATLGTTGERWVGGYTLSATRPITSAIINLVANNGLYADNGRQQYKRSVSVRIEAVPVNQDGSVAGFTRVWEGAVEGSATSRATRALTVRMSLGGEHTDWSFRARRLTPDDTSFSGTVVDEIKWRDVYGASEVDLPHFGNVTTAHIVKQATDGALAVKESKFNLMLTRLMPRWLGGQSFTTELYPTRSAADILSFFALDRHVGNRTLDEVDFENIYSTVEEVRSYFGFAEAADFSYTFDDNNMSFEEMVSAIATAIGCQAYRQGSKLRLFFERENPNSNLLFNHRNKLSGSETRTEEFGAKKEAYDGVSYQYISPVDYGPVTAYIPADRSAVNPKPIESVGVCDERQAHIHMWRAWNKIRYHHTTTEFMALPEASPLILRNRISVADNSRSRSQDGEIRGVEGLEVHLSQPMSWVGSAVMEIQSDDGQTEMIPVTRGRSDRHAVLSRAPRTPILHDGTGYVRTVFAMATDERRPEPFLVTEKGEADEKGCISLVAMNYDDRYYQNDFDYRA